MTSNFHKLAIATLTAAAIAAFPFSAAVAKPSANNCPILSLADAQHLVNDAERRARERGVALSIIVVDASGDLLAGARMDGAAPATVEIARGKAATAARTGTSTATFQTLSGTMGPAITTLPGIVAVEGGVPVAIGGYTVGAIGLSGGVHGEDASIANDAVAAFGR